MPTSWLNEVSQGCRRHGLQKARLSAALGRNAASAQGRDALRLIAQQPAETDAVVERVECMQIRRTTPQLRYLDIERHIAGYFSQPTRQERRLAMVTQLSAHE